MHPLKKIKTSKLKIVKSKLNFKNKKMNKLKFAIPVILFFMVTNAFAQTSFGIKGGLNLTDVKTSEDEDDSASSIKPGFHIGAILDQSINDAFSIETGLILDTKGVTYKDEFGNATYNTYYLNIPINFKAGYNYGNLKIFGTAGPYVATALSSKIKFTGEAKEIFGDETEVEISNDETGSIKRIDFGIAFGAGVEINRFQFSAGYDLGLTDFTNSTESSAYNRAFKISAAYLFGK